MGMALRWCAAVLRMNVTTPGLRPGARLPAHAVRPRVFSTAGGSSGRDSAGMRGSQNNAAGEGAPAIKLDVSGVSSDDPAAAAAAAAQEEEDMEDMFVEGPAGMEWGGPTRGGRYCEPTRFGDWERKGRCSDF